MEGGYAPPSLSSVELVKVFKVNFSRLGSYYVF